MLREAVQKISDLVTGFINKPFKVFIVCISFALIGLIFDGTLFHLWALHRDSKELEQKTSMTLLSANELRQKIKQAHDPQFIELEAHERFELAGEGELVFVFSDGE